MRDREDIIQLINRLVCRVLHCTGNAKVQCPSDDIVFQLDLYSLRDEAEAGRLNYLKDSI